MKRLIYLIEAATGSVGVTVAFLVLPLALSMGYEVAARYVFGAPTIWAYEIGYMIMGVHFLLGSAYTLKRGGHIRIDLIYTHLNAKKKAWVDFIGYVVFLIPFLILLTYYLGDYAYGAFESGEQTGQSAWNPLIWPFRALYVLAFALLLLQAIAEAMKCVRVIAHGPEINEERG
jgi:TRAP-type mannitol/chloroaromatic compound transport system permease small subunit